MSSTSDAANGFSYRPLDHPLHGSLLVIEPREGWVEVGDQDDLGRRPHWRRCRPFAIASRKVAGDRRELRPWLTVEHVRNACIDGRYDAARRSHGDAALRRPEEILGSVLPDPNHRNERVCDKLTWAEADTFCRLAEGMLADETQAEVICRWLGEMPLTQRPRVWTATRWSDWSYALLGYDRERGRWFAAPDRLLPDSHPPCPHRVLVQPDPKCGCRREQGHPTEPCAGAFLVFPHDDV